MNIRQLIDKLLDKWIPKIICFLIAVFFYLFFQVTLVEKKSFVVPLKIEDDGMVTNLTHMPYSVSVVIRAKSDVINSISVNDFSAFIQLSEYTESGHYDIPVKVNVSDKLLGIDPLEIRVKPEYVSGDLETKIAKFVKVKPTLVGEVAHGFEVTEISVTPSYAEIIGPESHVRKIEEINTAKVMVSNAMTGFSSETEYLPVNNIIDVIDKGPYRVTVSVNQIVTEKEFPNVGVLFKNLKSDLAIKEEVKNVSLLLSGTLLNLEKFSPALNTVSVDLSSIDKPGSYELPLVYDIPMAYTLLENNPKIVSIEVIKVEKNTEIEKTIEEIPAVETSEEEPLLEGTV